MLAVVNAGDDWDWVGSLYFYWNGFYLDWVIHSVLLAAVFKKEVLLALAKAAGLTLLWLAFYLLPVAEQMKNQVFKVTSNPLTYISERSYPIVSLFINSLKSSVFHAKTANLGTLLFVGLVVAVVSLASKKFRTNGLLVWRWYSYWWLPRFFLGTGWTTRL